MRITPPFLALLLTGCSRLRLFFVRVPLVALVAIIVALPALLIMIIGFYCFFAAVLLTRMRLEVLRREARASWVRLEINRLLEKNQ